MSNIYWFRCATPEHPRATSTLVIFSGPSECSEIELEDAITNSSKTAVAPEVVIIFVPKRYATKFGRKLHPNHAAFDPLASNTSVYIAGYTPTGLVPFTKILGSETLDFSEPTLAAMRRQGLTKLARDRGAVLESGPSAYFVKPSERPDNRFLRASQAMSEGAEIFLWHFGYYLY